MKIKFICGKSFCTRTTLSLYVTLTENLSKVGMLIYIPFCQKRFTSIISVWICQYFVFSRTDHSVTRFWLWVVLKNTKDLNICFAPLRSLPNAEFVTNYNSLAMVKRRPH